MSIHYNNSKQKVRDTARRADAEGRPLRILFVCLGNICRSPAAQGVMEQLVSDAGMEGWIECDSAGFYGGHRGDLPDPRMRKAAARRGLDLRHRSRTVKPSDFDDFDLIIGMDDNNIESLHSAARTLEDEEKIMRMTDFVTRHLSADSVPDPYWEGAEGFEIVLDLLEDACLGLLNIITKSIKTQ